MKQRTAYEAMTKYIKHLIEDMNNTIDFTMSEEYGNACHTNRIDWALKCLHDDETEGFSAIRFAGIWMLAITEDEMQEFKDELRRGYNAAWNRVWDELYRFEEKRGEQR